ncbi:hypothetical protein HPB48_020987 [Haemaphysalis longicornis]|uniref:SRCR domain-containing protein n=1 Tax=Haemaphysalis longicornis TaxID=44386 RepID=A0A9J6F9Z7_HAELO|nr:hypothetical protein HPB48_020987 [Haemaphysalis longicornis]
MCLDESKRRECVGGVEFAPHSCQLINLRRCNKAAGGQAVHRASTCAGPILMDNLYCTGQEQHIEECPFDGWGVHDCGRDEAAGVECLLPRPPPTTSDPPARAKKKIRVSRPRLTFPRPI